jgi:hypothetical protein
MIDGTLKLLAEKLEEERRIILESLGDGHAQDFAQYQNTVQALFEVLCLHKDT